MDQNVRRLSNLKQTSLKNSTGGFPTLGDLVDSSPEIRYVQGQGLYLIVRRNNRVYSIKFSETFE